MHLPFWHAYKRILHQLLVLNILEALIHCPWHLLPSFETLMIRVQWTHACEPESSFTMSPRSTTLPLHCWYRGSNSEFLRWQRSINDAIWTFLPLFLASSITSFLLWLSSAAMPECSPVFPLLLPLLPLHLDFPLLEASEWTCEQDCNDLENSSLCQWYDIGDVCVQLLPALVSCFRRHQQHKHILSCVIQYCGGSPLLFIGILQGIAAGIGTSNLVRAALMLSLNSSSCGSIKNIPLNCLAMSSFGFSIAHLCFAFFFRCIRHMRPHIWPYIVWTRGCLFSCSFFQTMCAHQVTFRSIRWILWSLSLHQIILFLYPRSNHLQHVSPSIHPRMYESFW